ncbi:MAG: hypothetical protein HS119_11535 [Flavobacteriales bacterium]|nr:hypothetical protein [Flavobacteriales bacterium]
MLCNLGDVVDYNAQSLAAILKEITETTDLKFKVVFEKLSLNQYQIFILFENNFGPSETHKLKNLFILFRETAKDINQENFQSWLSSEKSYHIEKLFTEISTQFK